MVSEVLLKFVTNESKDSLIKICNSGHDNKSIVICGSGKYRPIVAELRDSLDVDIFFMLFEGRSQELEDLGRWMNTMYPESAIKIL